eukprot:1161898-Pelagomonas_calceolata.AAC.2
MTCKEPFNWHVWRHGLLLQVLEAHSVPWLEAHCAPWLEGYGILWLKAQGARGSFSIMAKGIRCTWRTQPAASRHAYV